MSTEFLQRALEEQDQIGFLVGPDHDSDSLDVDDVFAVKWDNAMANLLEHLELGNDATAISDHISDTIIENGVLEYLQLDAPVLLVEAISTESIPSGVLAVTRTGTDFRIIGSYVGSELAVSDDWRGQGIGTRLVARRALLDGGLPTWDLDTPAYSHNGMKTHISAFNVLMEDAKLKAKTPDLDM